MREKLEKYLGIKTWFSFDLAKFANKVSSFYKDALYPTVLLTNVRTSDEEITDHAWSIYNKSFNGYQVGDKLCGYSEPYWYLKSNGGNELGISPIWVQPFSNNPQPLKLDIPQTLEDVLNLYPNSGVRRWDIQKSEILREIVYSGIGKQIDLNWTNIKDPVLKKASELYRDRELFQLVGIAQLINGFAPEAVFN